MFELAVPIVDRLFAKLGHDLSVEGISGQFKFFAEFKGSKADLVGALLSMVSS